MKTKDEAKENEGKDWEDEEEKDDAEGHEE